MLSKFEIDVTVLKEYPHVLKSMFTILKEPIPNELIPNIVSSNKSNRHSMGREVSNR